MKKKVLFINGHLNTGGVEKALLDVLQHLDYSRYEVDLLLTEQLGDYAPLLPPQVNILQRSIEGTYGPVLRVLLQSLCDRDWFTFKMRLIFLLKKLLGQKWLKLAKKALTDGKRYDCAIGFRPGFCTQVAVYATNAEHRITWWHHGEINVEPKTYLETALRCDRIAVVSNGCRDMLAKAFPALAHKLTVIHNMQSPEIVKQASAFNPYSEKDILHLVSVCRLVPEKHFENAIYVARKLRDRGIGFQWHLVGDGFLREELQAKAAEMSVTDCFVFEGNQVNPYPYMKHADLFVHPSYVESFGIVITEALSLGRPCVVTRSTGVMDFLCDGENALLTEQNPDDLAEKVLQVVENRDLREYLRRNAHCPDQFLPDVVIRKIDRLLGIENE